MSWQPIETAPKDGSTIILFMLDEDLVHQGYWSVDGKGWMIEGQRANGPTRNADAWQPMPEPPEIEWTIKF